VVSHSLILIRRDARRFYSKVEQQSLKRKKTCVGDQVVGIHLIAHLQAVPRRTRRKGCGWKGIHRIFNKDKRSKDDVVIEALFER